MRIMLVAILGLSTLADPAAACTCSPTTPELAFGKADVVFRGIVLEILVFEPVPGWIERKRATFQVLSCWKGTPGSSAYVWTEILGEACGFPFVFHDEYLVYATSFGSHGYYTDVCIRTQSWPPDLEDLEFLAEPGACGPVPVQATTWGRLKTLYR